MFLPRALASELRSCWTLLRTPCPLPFAGAKPLSSPNIFLPYHNCSTSSEQPQEPEEGPSLPLTERCKSLLVSNWRAQLTTVNFSATESTSSTTSSTGSSTSSSKSSSDQVRSSLVRLSLHDGSPVVWLPPGDNHAVNAMFDERCSLLVGSADPVGLIRAMRSVERAPTRAVMVGDLLAAEAAEIAYLRRLLESQQAALMRAAAPLVHSSEQAKPQQDDPDGGRNVAELDNATAALSSSSLFPSPLPLSLSPPSLGALPSSAQVVGPDWLPFHLACRQCQVIDINGSRSPVPITGIASAATDPLAFASVPLLDSFNRSEGMRRSLILFCAAYMGVELRKEGAYMVSLDRWGFNVLAMCEGKNEVAPAWREFRFCFQSGATSVNAFLHAIKRMEEETLGV